MSITIEQVCKRWSDPFSRPLFKGCLISDDGCCCAQGDVLRLSGYTDNQLRAMEQTNADREVARLLGISTAHAVLLRIVNDCRDGCPQNALMHPEKIVGSEWPTLKKFWYHLDRMTGDDWKKVFAAWTAAWDAARTAAWEIQGRSRLTKFFFLPMFGFSTPDEIK